MTVITLQQTYRACRSVMRMFCGDAVHIAAVERGEIICGHCGKPLFKSCIQRCSHGVYSPAGKSPCSLCKAYSLFEETEPTRKQAALLTSDPAIVRNGSGKYTEVWINSADLILKSDKHQPEKQHDEELSLLSALFESSSRTSLGFATGALRKEKLAHARTDTPAWILDIVSFREFILMQPHKARAAAVLYLHYVCSLTDGEIAERLRGAEGATRTYRHRLMHEGNLHFSNKQAA